LYREPLDDTPKRLNGASDPAAYETEKRPRPFYQQKKPLVPPVIMKRLDSPGCWLLYYFLLNLGLTVRP
jgi:hypothetical protein